MSTESLFAELDRIILSHFETTLQMREETKPTLVRFSDSLKYALSTGGKRFRPKICFLIAEALGHQPERVLPYAASVEMIHTYSLIHDDLPALDNDDFRRGRPTMHKAFDEATALLAGDSYLTEAFHLLASSYPNEPHLVLPAILCLSHAAGIGGMIGGQVIDVGAQVAGGRLQMQALEQMHLLKTGALIRAAAEGAAVICAATTLQRAQAREFGESLGLAFQIRDDLIEAAEGKLESWSFPGTLGKDESQRYLDRLTERCMRALETWDDRAEKLREMVHFNHSRNV